MANDGDHILVSDELLGRRDRLRGAALVIEFQEFQSITRKNRSLGVGLLDGQLRTMQHILALRSLIAGQRTDEADLHNRLTLAATPKTEHTEQQDDER